MLAFLAIVYSDKIIFHLFRPSYFFCSPLEIFVVKSHIYDYIFFLLLFILWDVTINVLTFLISLFVIFDGV